MFFLELPFWSNIQKRKVSEEGGGGAVEMLKKIYRPRVIFKIPGAPCLTQSDLFRSKVEQIHFYDFECYLNVLNPCS